MSCWFPKRRSPIQAVRPELFPQQSLSYVPTAEGWLYLAAIKDMATRQPDAERQSKIIGWSMADHLRAELCTAALVMALQRWQPAKGLICHSDRGGQYASADSRAVLERHGVTQSMSRRGNAWTTRP